MASSKIKGITIEIDGDTTKLGKSLEGVEKKSKNLQSELKGVNSLLKMDPSNVVLLQQKQDLLTQSISQTESKLNTLKIAQAQVQDQFDKGKITEEQFRDFQREIVATETKLKNLKDEMKDFGSVSEQQLKQAGKKIEEFGSKVEDAGKKLGGISAIAGAGLGVATKTASSLEGAVNKVVVATGDGTKSADNYKNVLQTIHDGNYGEDYNDIAEKVSFVKENMKNLSDTDLISITENAYLLQDAFGMDFNESIRGINGLMVNMGVDAQTAFDLMVTGAQNGLNKSDELGDNIAEYSQLWGQSGFSAEEMFTILQNGLDSGAYNLDKVNDLVKEMGISLTDGRVEDHLSSFSTNTQDLFEKWKTGGASQADVIKSMIKDLGEMENEQEALTLASDIWSALGEDNAMAVITSLNKANDAYKNTSGSINEANEQMYSGTGAKAEQALKRIETAFQTMGDKILPILAPIIEKIAELATKFSNLDPTIQTIIVVIGGIVTALAPVIITIGKVISAVGQIVPLLSKIAPIFGVIKTAVSGLFTLIAANPVIAIIMAIIGVIVLLWTKCEWFRDLVKGLWEGIKAGFEVAIEWISGALSSIGEFFVNLWEGIKVVFAPVIDYYKMIFSTAWEAIKAIWNNVTGYFKAIWETIKGVFSVVKDVLTGNWKGAWEGIKGIVNTWINYFKGVWDGIKNVFGGVADWFRNIFTKAWTAVKNVFSTGGKIFDGIKDGIASTFKTVVNGIIGGINKVISIPFNSINKMLNTIRKVSFFDIAPFKNLWSENPLPVPQIPKLNVGTNNVKEEGLAYLHKGEAVVTEKYNPAIHDDVMKDSIMDALTNFTNTRYQNNGGQTGINELTKLMKQYMPQILSNMGQDIIMDKKVIAKTIAPDINKELGYISSQEQRGY